MVASPSSTESPAPDCIDTRGAALRIKRTGPQLLDDELVAEEFLVSGAPTRNGGGRLLTGDKDPWTHNAWSVVRTFRDLVRLETHRCVDCTGTRSSGMTSNSNWPNKLWSVKWLRLSLQNCKTSSTEIQLATGTGSTPTLKVSTFLTRLSSRVYT